MKLIRAMTCCNIHFFNNLSPENVTMEHLLWCDAHVTYVSYLVDCGKVMFSQVFVCSQVGGKFCLPAMPWGRQTPPIGRHPLDTSTSGRYASYWNVFLFLLNVFAQFAKSFFCFLIISDCCSENSFSARVKFENLHGMQKRCITWLSAMKLLFELHQRKK